MIAGFACKLITGGPKLSCNGCIHLNDKPGHGLTLNEDTARAHVKNGYSYFGDNA